MIGVGALVGCVLFTVLQAVDFFTTYKVLTHPGGYEDAPIARWLMGEIGLVPALVLMKLGAAAAVWLVYWKGGWSLTFEGAPVMLIFFGLLILYYANVMRKNIDWMRRQRRGPAL